MDRQRESECHISGVRDWEASANEKALVEMAVGLQTLKKYVLQYSIIKHVRTCLVCSDRLKITFLKLNVTPDDVKIVLNFFKPP